MSSYCAQNSAAQNFQCRGNLGSCSRVFENTPNNPCLTWYNNVFQQAVSSNNPVTLDTWITQYCGANTSSGDCVCANAYNNPEYTSLITATNSVASCWYAPCSGPATQSQLQPSSVLANQFGHSPCPADVCSNVEQFINSTGAQNNPFTQQLI